MAEYFLSKIRIDSTDFVEAGGRPALERHAELRQLLLERAGPEVAGLFAEPLISRGNDASPPTVSWYGDVEAEARPLASLSGSERDAVESYLSEHLRPLRALADDPQNGDLALGALSVYGRDDILVQGGRPVIVNWGLMPGGNGANAASRPVHFAATLGKYIALTGPQLTSSAAGVAGVAGVAAGGAAAGPPNTPVFDPVGSAGAVPPTERSRSRLSPIAWVPLLVLLLLAFGVLAWLLWPGTRLFHADGPPPVVTEQGALNAAEALNRSLREQELALQIALDGAVCRADGVLVLPGGRTPDGRLLPALEGEPLTPGGAQTAPVTEPPTRGDVPITPGAVPTDRTGIAPGALLPPAPERVQVGGDTTLLSLIEARTVLILASGPNGSATGSGFSVAPGLIVTNFHVVEGAEQIWVAGAGLARPEAAVMIKSLGPLEQAGGDFALLQISTASLPTYLVHMPAGSLKLTNVIAAGFPGDVLAVDEDFEALTTGNVGAMPDLTVTDGTINTEQNMGPTTRVLMHSAPLSGGNSGGPLVDMCGRLLGVNTFVRQGPMQNRGFALSAADLLAFLAGTEAAGVAQTAEPCAPVVVRPQVVDAQPAPAQPAED
ncbi:MAG: serine protease [Rhodobacteraceae bacterium]|nr:serine protease [Paracoccaceae bacterium]